MQNQIPDPIPLHEFDQWAAQFSHDPANLATLVRIRTSIVWHHAVKNTIDARTATPNYRPS